MGVDAAQITSEIAQFLRSPETAAFADLPSSTGWTFDQSAGRFRNLSSGQFLSATDMIQLRNDFVDSRGAAVSALARNLIDGGLSLAEWQAGMEAEIKITIGVEYAFGAGGILNMTADDWSSVQDMVASQFDYLDGFAQAIYDGKVSDAQLLNRASMYSDAGIQAFERGQASAFDIELPVYPGEDCEGGTNCRCFWAYEEQGDGTVEATWVAVGDNNTCDPCAQHADDYSPLVLEPDTGLTFSNGRPVANFTNDPEGYALSIIERNAGVEPARFGWVTINGNHVLIADASGGAGGSPIHPSVKSGGPPDEAFLKALGTITPARPPELRQDLLGTRATYPNLLAAYKENGGQLPHTAALIGPDGTVYTGVTHDWMAEGAMRTLGETIPDRTIAGKEAALRQMGIDRGHLVRASLLPDPPYVGVSIQYPPTAAQLQSIRQGAALSRGGAFGWGIEPGGHTQGPGTADGDDIQSLEAALKKQGWMPEGFSADFGWVTINGEHVLIGDVKVGHYSVGITADQFASAKLGDKAQSFELQSALSHLKATDVQLTIGRGGWKDDTGKLFEENALNLQFKDGPPAAVAGQMAKLGSAWNQQSALVQRFVRSGGEAQATIDMGRRLNDAEVTDIAGKLGSTFGGWTFSHDPASGSTRVVLSNVAKWGGPPEPVFKAQVHAVADELNQSGLDTSVGWRRVENIVLDGLNTAKLNSRAGERGQTGRRDSDGIRETERPELSPAHAQTAGSVAGAGPERVHGDVPSGIEAGLEAGILAKLEAAEQLRQTVAAFDGGGGGGHWVTIDDHPVLIGTPQEMAAAHATIAALKNPATGFVVGAPPGAQTAQGLLELRAHLDTLATQGEAQKNWYSDSNAAILAAAQGDKADAAKLAQLVAIYSPNTSPTVDMNDALDAWYQWKAGVPIKVGMGARDEAASNLLYNGQNWEGRKTNNFYRNLMVGIDPVAANALGAEVGQSGVTADIWMMRAFKYTAPEGAVTDAGQPRGFKNMPSPRQYDFIASEVNRVAQQRGWAPEQVQAAIWSATKAKAEGTSTDAAGYTFADALAERTGLVSAGTTSAFRDSQGRDILARTFGLVGGDNTFALPKAPQSSGGHDIPGNAGRVQEDARAAISAYTASRALLLEQPTATWTRVFPTTTLKSSNATVLDAGRPLTPTETSTLNSAINSTLGRTNAHALVPTETGAWILNTTQPPGKAPSARAVDNTAFQKAMASAVSKLTTVDTTVAPARYDGESLKNDWTKNPNGETYRAVIRRSGQADKFGAVADSLAARIAAAAGSTTTYGRDNVEEILDRLDAEVVQFGWVTIDGNHVFIGDRAGGGLGVRVGNPVPAGRSSLTPLVMKPVGAPIKATAADPVAAAAAVKQLDNLTPGAGVPGRLPELLSAAMPATTVNLDGLLRSETMPAVRVFAHLAQDYPVVAEHVAFIGNTDFPPTGLPYDFTTRVPTRMHPSGVAPMGETIKVVGHQAPDGTYAPDSAIGLNPVHFGAERSTLPESALASVDITRAASDGYFPSQATDAGWVAAHEFGHAVQTNLLSTPAGKAANEVLFSLNGPRNLATLSTYATTNEMEAFAEMFAAHYYGSTNSAANDMGDTLKKVYGSAPQLHQQVNHSAAFDDGHWVTIDGQHVLIGSSGKILQGGSHLGGPGTQIGNAPKHTGTASIRGTVPGGDTPHLVPLDPHAYLIHGFDTSPGQAHTPLTKNQQLLADRAQTSIGTEAVQPALNWSAEPTRAPDNVVTEVAAHAVFGIGKTDHLPASVQPDPKRMAVVMQTYSVTQRALSEQHIQAMTVYRGTSYTAQSVPPSLAALKPGESKTISMDTAPLSSFSIHEDQALLYTHLFGGQGGGQFVASTTVERSAIFGTPQQGWGNPAVHEVVVLGGPRQYVVTRLPESTPATHSTKSVALPSVNSVVRQSDAEGEVNLDAEPQNADWLKLVGGVTKARDYAPKEDSEQPAAFKAPYEFSSTQVNLPDDLARLVRAYQATIDPNDLADGGLEEQPHVTLLFGLHANVTADDVARVVGAQPQVTATFGVNATFPEGKDGVPLFVAVDSAGLKRLNAALLAQLPNTQTYSGYTPHMTIAYLKPAVADKYVSGQDGPLNGRAATFDTVMFSGTDRNQTPIPLGRASFADGGHWVTIDGNPVLIGGLDPRGPVPANIQSLSTHQALAFLEHHPPAAHVPTSALGKRDDPATKQEESLTHQAIPSATIDIGTIPAAIAHPFDVALATVAQSYPAVAAKLSFAGSYDAKSSPMLTPAAAVESHSPASAFPLDAIAATNARMGVIGINPFEWSYNVDGTSSKVANMVQAAAAPTRAWFPPEAAAIGPGFLAIHEFGHVVHQDILDLHAQALPSTGDPSGPNYQDRFSGLKPVSYYSIASDREFFAETFAAYYAGSTAPAAVVMGKVLTDAYGAAPQAPASLRTAAKTGFADGDGHWVTIDGNPVMIGGPGAGGATVRDRGAPATGQPPVGVQPTPVQALAYLREPPGTLPRATLENMVSQALPSHPIVSLIDLTPAKIQPQLVALAEVAQDYPLAGKDLAYVGVQMGVGEPRSVGGGPIYWAGGAFAEVAFVEPAGQRAMGFNSAFYGSPPVGPNINAEMQASVDSHWFPPEASQPGYIATHEFGHVVADNMVKTDPRQYMDWIQANPPDPSLSLYSVTTSWSGAAKATVPSDNERFAEAFAAYYGGSAHPLAVSMGTLLTSFYGSAPRRSAPS